MSVGQHRTTLLGDGMSKGKPKKQNNQSLGEILAVRSVACSVGRVSVREMAHRQRRGTGRGAIG